MIPLIQIFEIGTGPSITLIGIMGLLLAASILFRNAAAGVLWALSMVLFIFTVILELPIEIFYMAIMATGFAVAIGIGLTWRINS